MLPPWLKVGRMLSGLRVGIEGYDTRREIARWVANAGSISTIVRALHGTVADFGSDAAARAEIEIHDVLLDQGDNPVSKFAKFVHNFR
jgi:hypothetical protein